MTETNMYLSEFLATQDGGDFFRKTNASFKQGVKFCNWNTDANGKRIDYVNPFAHGQMLYGLEAAEFFLRFGNGDRDFTQSISPHDDLARLCKGARPLGAPEFEQRFGYAYHLDAVKFAGLLTKICTKRGVEHIRDGPVGRHPRGLDWRCVPAPCRCVGTGHGSERHVQKHRVQTVQGYRRTGDRLPRPPAHRRPALHPVGPTYPETRQGGRIGSGAAIIAVAAKRDGKREVVGLGLGPSEAEPLWIRLPARSQGPVASTAPNWRSAPRTAAIAPLSSGCSRSLGNTVGGIGCALHSPMPHAADTASRSPRFARLSIGQTRHRRQKPGVRWPIVCAPDGRSWRNRWTPANMTCRSV